MKEIEQELREERLLETSLANEEKQNFTAQAHSANKQIM